MDIIGGLSAAKLALDLTKDLRDIDRSVDEAGYKLMRADLTSALADTKVALADAKVRMSDLEAELANESRGKLCPVCLSGRLVINKVEPCMGVGSEIHYSSCDATGCFYQANRLFESSLGHYKANK